MSICIINNKIYFIGGYAYSLYNQTQIYDPRTDSWKLGTPIPTAMLNAAAAATTGITSLKRIYVVGGSVYGSGINALDGTGITQVYDPNNDNWTLGAPMLTARLDLTLAVMNDQIYAIGGSAYPVFSPSLKANEQYTPFGYGTPDPTYDGSPPEISMISPKNETYHQSSIPLEFSVNEPASLMHYKLDKETIVEISGNTTISGLSFGSHGLTVYATDGAGNTGVSETLYFVIEAPELIPVVPVATASVIVIAVVGAGLLLYFRKRRDKPAFAKEV